MPSRSHVTSVLVLLDDRENISIHLPRFQEKNDMRRMLVHFDTVASHAVHQ